MIFEYLQHQKERRSVEAKKLIEKKQKKLVGAHFQLQKTLFLNKPHTNWTWSAAAVVPP